MKKLLNRRTDLADLFKGFNSSCPRWWHRSSIGLWLAAERCFCIIPGLVLAAMFEFTYLFIVTSGWTSGRHAGQSRGDQERLFGFHHVLC